MPPKANPLFKAIFTFFTLALLGTQSMSHIGSGVSKFMDFIELIGIVIYQGKAMPILDTMLKGIDIILLFSYYSNPFLSALRKEINLVISL